MKPTRTELPNAVKMSGAVSPAMRATATSAPVTMPGKRGAQHDAERRAPLRVAERQRRFAHRDRHETNHFLGRARDERNHHRRERDAAGERREVLERAHEQLPGEDAEHDRRKSVRARRTESARRSRAWSRAARRGTSPAPIPIGSPMTDAISTSMIPVPTIAFAIPPPVSPVGAGIFVKKFQFTDAAPCFSEVPENEAAAAASRRWRRRTSDRS